MCTLPRYLNILRSNSRMSLAFAPIASPYNHLSNNLLVLRSLYNEIKLLHGKRNLFWNCFSNFSPTGGVAIYNLNHIESLYVASRNVLSLALILLKSDLFYFLSFPQKGNYFKIKKNITNKAGKQLLDIRHIQ